MSGRPPGQAAYPYHWHYQEEELLVVLEGAPTLRTADGRRRLERGEVVSFPTGEAGGHQILNDTEEEVRFLALSTQGEPDLVMYPESGKLGVFERLPQGDGCTSSSASRTRWTTGRANNPPPRPANR